MTKLRTQNWSNVESVSKKVPTRSKETLTYYNSFWVYRNDIYLAKFPTKQDALAFKKQLKSTEGIKIVPKGKHTTTLLKVAESLDMDESQAREAIEADIKAGNVVISGERLADLVPFGSLSAYEREWFNERKINLPSTGSKQIQHEVAMYPIEYCVFLLKKGLKATQIFKIMNHRLRTPYALSYRTHKKTQQYSRRDIRKMIDGAKRLV